MNDFEPQVPIIRDGWDCLALLRNGQLASIPDNVMLDELIRAPQPYKILPLLLNYKTSDKRLKDIFKILNSKQKQPSWKLISKTLKGTNSKRLYIMSSQNAYAITPSFDSESQSILQFASNEVVKYLSLKLNCLSETDLLVKEIFNKTGHCFETYKFHQIVQRYCNLILPCPVCGRTKDGDCSWYPDGETVMCKTYVDGSGHDESQWHYNGVNELGFQGTFIRKTEKEFKKKPRPIGTRYFEYPTRDGENLARVQRIDFEDKDKDTKQQSWNGTKWIFKIPREVRSPIPIYRYAEVQAAIERNELIFVVEGETTADALWELGIAATTTIGGSGGYAKYGADYADDLKGARLVLAPDRDTNGIKYISNFDRDFSSQVEGYYLAGSPGLWKNPQGGMDVYDDIQDHGYTQEQILGKVISPGDYQEAIACVDNPEQDGAALLLEFKTFKGDIRRWTMLRAYLAGDGSAIAEGLLSRGYNFKRKQKGALLDYIQSLGSDVEKTYTVTELSGWVNGSFVLPHKTYGDEDLRFRDVDPIPDAITEMTGTLQGWIDTVAARCADNSRLILAIGSSFAAPLLPIADVESGGFHLVGSTSQGKTTILSVAASVTGLKIVSSWRTTDNALEGGLAASNHSCLPLDELNQADSRKVGAIVYMLGNGIGKGRSTKDGTNRKPKVWLTLVLSSGETTIGKFMELAAESIKGGQEVRLPNIPAVPDGSLYGCFETIHGADTAVQFVSALEAAVKQHHGVALDAFLSRLVVDAADLTFAGNISKQVNLIAAKLSEGTKDSAIGRVAKRFALVQVSLGLAHKYGLLPFPTEQIDWAISTVFKDWLKARGGDGSIEVKQAIARIEHLLVTNEFSDRVFTLPDNSGLKVRSLLAYRKLDSLGQTEEFRVPTSVFDEEFCGNVNKTELVKELQRLAWLIPPRKDGKSIHQRSIKGNADYYYVFGKRKNSGEGSESSEGDDSNAYSDEVLDLSSYLHYSKNPSEGSEGFVSENDANLHRLHQPSLNGEGKEKAENDYPISTLDEPSLPSLPSQLKTELEILNKLKVGDLVMRTSTGERGKLSMWFRDRRSAMIELDDGSISDWVEVSDLRLLAEVA